MAEVSQHDIMFRGFRLPLSSQPLVDPTPKVLRKSVFGRKYAKLKCGHHVRGVPAIKNLIRLTFSLGISIQISIK
ncbi:MAG: hypothetical protein PHE53_02575 [Thermoguttaceae bacterium]|nr:hypothetical protein [Thermoguttaceae bacterium]